MLILCFTLIGLAAATPDICGQTFEVLAGQTRTINYLFDGNYPGNANCVFHLRGTGGNRLRISFTEFDIEKHPKCSFDYLQVFDGATVASHSLNKLCGYEVPTPLETQGNEATLKFVSDRTVHKAGFILQFTTRSDEQFTGNCAPTFTKTSGSFQSPLYPSNYPNRVNCTYEIAPSTGNQIVIQFTTFQLETSSSCVMDHVTITTRTGQQIGPKLCGDLGGNSYLVPGSHAIIHFISDKSITRQGFELQYQIVDSCKELDDICADGCAVGNDNMMQCICRSGYSAPTGEAQCYDVNECRTNNGGCADYCKNTQGSYECECRQDGFFLSPDGRNCTDRTCTVNNAGCEHHCHLSGDGGYSCTCNQGYLIANDGHNCTDIDECTDTKYGHGCEQLCKNEPGSYYCDCEEGFILSSNRRTCDDINECVANMLTCEQDCLNYPGGWSCSCYQGYHVNPVEPTGCIDIDECSPDIAPPHCTDCVNYEGGFTCTECQKGFQANENETTCLDIDECQERNGGCQQECINTQGSYHCACYGGQEMITGKEAIGACKDINECAPNDGRGPCEHYCENLVGTFTCHCLEGYEVITGIACRDINECATLNGGCSQQCDNSQGSYTCSCFDGYWMMDGSCNDVDECIQDKPCDSEVGAECVNTVGSFQCICPSGYNVINTTICDDIDECANGTFGTTHGCKQKCVNTDGSYHCGCFDGFTDLGNNTCVDLNECSLDLCEYEDYCTNNEGSFTCGCPDGYFLLDDGLHCNDVDECAGSAVLCHQVCNNEIGHYKCGCLDGYELDNDNYTCNDINECLRNISGCSDGCVNYEGAYRCYCHLGFHFMDGSNKTCIDTDECATDNAGCHHVCDNTEGSYSCSCHDGYEAGADARCHDINECATDNGGCGQTCNNFEGTYNCTCSPDFKLGDDDHSCGHCPTCEQFEQVQSDVESLKRLSQQVTQLEQANMRLSALVAQLQSQISSLQITGRR